MAIIVSGASGELGRKVTELLLKEVEASELILLTRNPDSLADMSAQGAQVRKADFDDTENLADALKGGDIMLLISTLSIGRRFEQHSNAITAAKQAGVSHVIYTSSMGIQPQTPSLSGKEHYATEQFIQASGLKFTFLRNSWYADVLPTIILPPSFESGALVSSVGDGCVAPVAKQDCANVAAAVLLNADKHENSIYEITGPNLVNFHEIAALAADVAGKPLKFVNLPHDEMLKIFDAMGVNREYEEGMMSDSGHAWASEEMVTYEMAIKQHYFSICSHHVELITGKPAISLRKIMEDNL